MNIGAIETALLLFWLKYLGRIINFAAVTFDSVSQIKNQNYIENNQKLCIRRHVNLIYTTSVKIKNP